MVIAESKNVGKIITFYSFKGGVGRTMALSNVAALLSKWGRKVLIIDFDLEAPGVEKYFSSQEFSFSKKRRECEGVVDLLTSFKESSTKIRWQDCLIQVSSSKYRLNCDIIPAGKDSFEYASKLQNLNWDNLFEKYNLGKELETLRNEWLRDYDFVLIDSRTGISDIGGICTIYLPDIVAFLFTTNDASLDGCIDIIKRAKESRKKLSFDRNLLITIPIPSRDESRTEFESSQKWKNIFEERLRELYNDWLPRDISIKSAIDLLKVPYIPYWSFGDRLPVIEEGTSENSIGYSYEKIALLINNDFDWSKVKTGFTTYDIESIIEKKENTFSSKTLNMEMENYLNERVGREINYFSRLSLNFKLFHIAILTTQIVLGALLIILPSFGISSFLNTSLIGVLIIILTGLQEVGDFKEKGVQYRKKADRIRQERYKFMIYSDEIKRELFQDFANKIEKIISGENRETSNSIERENNYFKSEF